MNSEKILNFILIFLIVGLCALGGYFYFVNNTSSEDLAGVDTNNNDIRDDVEEYVNSNYGQDNNLKVALMEFARYMQLEILNSNNKELSIKYSHEEGPVLGCVFNLSHDIKVGGKEAYKDISDKVTNTNSRRAAYRKYNSNLGGQVYTGGSYGCQDVPGMIFKVGTTTEYSLKESGVLLQTYNNPSMSFEVDYPSNWNIQIEDSEKGLLTLATTPKEDNIHGIGLPPSGMLWINIAKGVCNEPTTDFVSQVPDVNVSEKTTCKDGFQITTGLWNDDSYPAAHKNLLNIIQGSFRLVNKINN